VALGWLEIAKRTATFWDCRQAVMMTFSKVVCVAEFRAGAKELDRNVGAVGHGTECGHCGGRRLALSSMGIVVTVGRAEGGTAEAAAHGTRYWEIFEVGAFDIMTVPGITSVFVVGLVLGAERRATSTPQPLAFDRDGPTGWVVADELTWSPFRAMTPMLIAVLWTNALPALAREIRPEIAVASAPLDVTLAVDREGGGWLWTALRHRIASMCGAIRDKEIFRLRPS